MKIQKKEKNEIIEAIANAVGEVLLSASENSKLRKMVADVCVGILCDNHSTLPGDKPGNIKIYFFDDYYQKNKKYGEREIEISFKDMAQEVANLDEDFMTGGSPKKYMLATADELDAAAAIIRKRASELPDD